MLTRAERSSRSGMLVGVLILLGGLLAGGNHARAHTQLDSSTPAAGETVSVPVADITLVWSGPIAPVDGGFQALDPQGQLRPPVAVTRAGSDTLVLHFDPALAGGAVELRWAVTSADGHVIDGAIGFTVDAAVPTTSTTSTLPATTTSVPPAPTTAPSASTAAAPADVAPASTTTVAAPATTEPDGTAEPSTPSTSEEASSGGSSGGAGPLVAVIAVTAVAAGLGALALMRRARPVGGPAAGDVPSTST